MSNWYDDFNRKIFGYTDKNKDGRVTYEEVRDMIFNKEWKEFGPLVMQRGLGLTDESELKFAFACLDFDGNGVITIDEMNAFSSMSKEQMFAFSALIKQHAPKWKKYENEIELLYETLAREERYADTFLKQIQEEGYLQPVIKNLVKYHKKKYELKEIARDELPDVGLNVLNPCACDLFICTVSVQGDDGYDAYQLNIKYSFGNENADEISQSARETDRSRQSV
jgi:hypothetical protein